MNVSNANAQSEIEGGLTQPSRVLLYHDFPAAIFTLDVTGTIIEANPAAARLCNREPASLLGAKIEDLGWMMDTAWRDLIHRRDDRAHSIKAKFRVSGGWGHLKVWVLPGGRDEGPGKLRLVCLDVTEEKRAESALQASERKFRHFVELSRDLVWSVDREGRFIYLNPATRTIYGYDPEEMLGLPMIDFAATELRGRDFAAFQGVLREEGLLHYETEHRAKDGRPIYLSLSAMPLRDGGGKIIGATGTAVDISGRKQAEMAIEKLAAFPRFNPYAVLEFNRADEITYYNAAALELAKSFGENHPRAILPEAAPQIIQTCLNTNQSRLRYEDTTEGRTISWSFFPILQGKVVHCYASEITERRNLENQLRQAQKMECVGQLAGGIAHDFNNILTIIEGHISLARQKSSGNPDLEESLHEIDVATQRAANLTQQLLTFSRKRVIQTRKLDLKEVVTNMFRMLRPLLSAEIDLHVECREETTPIRGDQGMIEQIVLNLVLNARDAMPNGGRLSVGTGCHNMSDEEAARIPNAKPGPCVFLSVTDSGVGIGPEHLQHIFEPFFTTKDIGKGTGLGLATVYGIMQQHKGWIQVSSQLGKGSTFKIFIPRDDSAEVSSPSLHVSEPTRRGRATILVVEDESPLRALTRVVLTNEGFKVLTAPNGPKALELWHANQENINLLLSDVVMPGGMSGIDLAKRLLEERRDLKVILSSGYSQELSGGETRLPENALYLQKPYSTQALIDMVHQSLASRNSNLP